MRRTRAIPLGGRAGAAILLALFLALGAVYSVVNPALESMDEIHHYGYIRHLAAGNGLPVQRPGTETAYAQEGSQPPLYYVLGQGFTGWVDTAEGPFIQRENPYVQTGVALTEDNANALVHGPGEAWPWSGELLKIHLLRFYSLLLGACTVWGTYHLATTLFPEQAAVALASTAFVALNPQFIYLSGSINNDNLVIALATWALVVLVRVVKGELSWPLTLALGGLLGLAALSKVSALALWPIAAVGLAAAILLARTPSPAGGAIRSRVAWRPARVDVALWLKHTLVLLAIAAAIAGWWYARNLSLYGELLGIETMLDIFGRRDAVGNLADAVDEIRGFRYSYWGLFGSFNVAIRPTWVYALLEIAPALGAAGLVRRALRAWRGNAATPDTRLWVAIALLLVWIVTLHVSLVRWTLMTHASQGRLVFPAIAAISLLTAWGLSAWFPPRWQPRAFAAAVFPLGILAVVVPWAIIAPAYAGPARLDPAQVPETATPFGTRYGDAIELLAFEVDPRVTSPGEPVRVTLYWNVLAPVDHDYTVYLQLFGRNGARIAHRDSLAGMAVHTSSRWTPGEVVRDVYTVVVSDRAAAPVAARLNVGLYDGETLERLPATDGLGREVLQPTLGYVKIAGAGATTGADRVLDYTLGPGVRLTGYDLNRDAAVAGGSVTLTLYWETAPLDRDYTVLVHAVGDDGTVVGQGDGPPLNGEYPTSYWGAGERLRDRHTITIERDAPPGQVTLYVGLYDPADDSRLPVSGEGVSENRAPAGTLLIAAP